MNKLYASIGPDSTIEDIRLLLAEDAEKDPGSAGLKIDKPVEKVKEDPNEVGVEQQDYDPAVQYLLDGYQLSVDQLSDYLDKIQAMQDNAWLQQIKDEATNTLNTYTKAYDATMFYTKGWFSRLFLSIEAKVDLANYLLSVIEPLCKSNLDTLKMVANRDSDMIQYVSWARDDI
jgi:hypothetical protein